MRSKERRTRHAVTQNVDALAQLIEGKLAEGWRADLLTIIFRQLPKTRIEQASLLEAMSDEVQRFYRHLITRAVRRPLASSARALLPILIAAPDLPVSKRAKSTSANRISTQNDGLHWHGVLLMPPRSRLRDTSVAEHVLQNGALYRGDAIRLLDARPITETPATALRYALKGVLRRRFAFDDVLLLPRSTSEATATTTAKKRR